MLITVLSLLLNIAHADYTPLTADWSDTAIIPAGTNRANIYNLDPVTLEQMKMEGYKHAMVYPVSVTGLLIPYQPLKHFFNSDSNNPIKKILLSVGKGISGFGTEAELYQWLGLSKVNDPSATGIYKMPIPDGYPSNTYAGASLIKSNGADGLTFSCFTCHAQRLFGKTVMGLTNKHPHANKIFHMGRTIFPLIPNDIFKIATKSSPADLMMFARTKKNIMSVRAVIPQVLGLDTSLPQVALSLAHRNDDEYATKSKYYERYPRANELSSFVSDSKPMPWWNLKYKTRWLADGSITEGNPILTNILWNEIGRGADLVELETWMKNNRKTIDELTVAAFATEAPKWTDFFPANSIHLERAKKGEQVFKQSCQKCHGEYQKAWSSDKASDLNDVEILATTNVVYQEQTRSRDVSTDSNRSEGVKAFADTLNNLAISKWMKTVVTPQVGYVAPPLVGIWARYPYLHNNSIPNLCVLLTAPNKRPKVFVQGPADDAETDYDQSCVGYPIGDKMPKSWAKNTEALYVAGKPGMSNLGHSKAILGPNGEELLTPEDKTNVIEFLKTL